MKKKIDIKNTIIFFDEIQKSERAINSLKYFCESEEKYNIICAGSLLGVKLNRFKSSFPVGKVKFATMYPIDFEEFLVATDNILLLEQIKNCYNNITPMAESLHIKALDLYKQYICVGGMPASVCEFLNCNKDILEFRAEEIKAITTSYIADMSKYTDNTETIKINNIYDSLVPQLKKENKKFMYKYVNGSARNREYETSVKWLEQSDIIIKVNNISSVKVPMEAYKSDCTFKVYFNDVGILVYFSKTPYNTIILNEDVIFKGAITENYIAQTLKFNKYDFYYHSINQNLEIDFLIYKDGDNIPIEVKSSNNTAKSLNKYMKLYKPKYGIKISTSNFAFIDNIKYIPLYSAFLI
ncbi:MAG: DUF4143 domain-containing protein [Clostridia bacterium]